MQDAGYRILQETGRSGAAIRVYPVTEQFMKGQDTSEISVMEKIPLIRVIRNTEDPGWLNLEDEEQKRRFTQLHNASMNQIRQLMAEQLCDVLILDEVTYPYRYDLIDRKALQELVLHRPQQMEIVLTGRDPDPFLLEQADYITEMKCIRHPYNKGIKARKGIEF